MKFLFFMTFFTSFHASAHHGGSLLDGCLAVLGGEGPSGGFGVTYSTTTCGPTAIFYYPTTLTKLANEGSSDQPTEGLMKLAGPYAGMVLDGRPEELDVSTALILENAQNALREEPEFSQADKNILNQEIFRRSKDEHQ